MNYEQKYHEALERANEAVKRGMVSQNFVDDIFGVESEYERIRKELIGGLMWQRDNLNANGRHDDNLILPGFTMRVGDLLAYLEKQKEQKPDLERITRSWYMEGYTDGEFKREPMWNLVTGKGGPRYEKNEKYGQPLEQKPTEWSEEDERMYKAVSIALTMPDAKGYLRSWYKTPEEADTWLKSLRPQPKQLKEANKEGFQTARHATALAFIKYCDKIRPNGKMCLSNGECEEIEKAFLVGDWEKIERYFHKYSWKPSEEQMEAFRIVLEHEAERIGSSKELSLANSLYEQLKALM